MAGLFHGRSTVARGRCKEGGAYRQHMVVRCAGCGVPGQGWRADGSSCGAALRANTLGPRMFSTPWRPRRGLVLARYAPETSGLQVQEGGDLSNYSMIENRLQRPVIGRQQLFISYCNMAPNGYRLFWPLAGVCGRRGALHSSVRQLVSCTCTFNSRILRLRSSICFCVAATSICGTHLISRML